MTYSIAARDPVTGEMGLATQSQAFAVGSSVPWAEPGYGVIATQSIAEPYYGELGLDLLRGGMTATESLHAMRSIDPHPERRQVVMIDARGDVAVYTGDGCVAAAGHRVGEHCCALANLVVGPQVWNDMVDAFEATSGPLANRLVSALVAAEAAGGDLRGRRSAAVVVVRAERTGRPWQDQLVDLRVDDHDDPVTELCHLVETSDTYHDVVRGFELAIDGDPVRGATEIDELDLQRRDDPDLLMWRAAVLAMAGRADEAVDAFARLHRDHPQFVEAARRMVPAGIFTDKGAVLEAIDRAAEQRG